jgi:putative ABC transport system ATP-binding protein
MLIAKGIKKSYDGRPVLKGIDLSVADGEFISIMGESGSGKSTLLSILSGNMRPDEGSVHIGEIDITRSTERELSLLRRTSLGFVYQSLNLISTLSAEDNILLPLYLGREDIGAGRARLLEIAREIGISSLLSKYPDKMSGGERQRVAIARAVIHNPTILMMDEPTGSLDTKSTTEVLELVRRLNRERGISVIQVTHSPSAAAYADRIITVADGEVLES